ncbi:MAG: hypothetical protein C6W57_16655 [Caldibacillus debilis]|nr:MAG: hypothetical protein C6W57_16655 [Caldibacillus debilis]REJ26703.1 MAG: hypothetical protein C6W56_11675 [Caldibacillus debilis]
MPARGSDEACAFFRKGPIRQRPFALLRPAVRKAPPKTERSGPETNLTMKIWPLLPQGGGNDGGPVFPSLLGRGRPYPPRRPGFPVAPRKGKAVPAGQCPHQVLPRTTNVKRRRPVPLPLRQTEKIGISRKCPGISRP